jgi:hypothetical protein
VPDEEVSLDTLIQRLDVLCSVVEMELKPGGRATKNDLRILHGAAEKVIAKYLQVRGEECQRKSIN